MEYLYFYVLTLNRTSIELPMQHSKSSSVVFLTEQISDKMVFLKFAFSYS